MKKLIPAICMTLIAAFMLASSTFAWFSMNTTVTANNMQIKAESKNPYLQIVAGTSAEAFKSNEKQDSATATNPEKTVRPTSAVKSFTTTELTALDNATKAADIKWVEAFSNDPALSNKATDYTEVTEKAKATDDTNVYTLINDFLVRLNPTADKTARTLSVTSVTITAATEGKAQLLPAVRVLIVCGDNWAIYSSTGLVRTKVEGSVLSTNLNDTPQGIKVYVYFDGEDSATTLNNATAVAMSGYKVEFKLSVNSVA